MSQKTAIIIFGPTASGKTSLGINIARKLNGIIINADSRQIYKEMPIITAMPSAEEFSSAPHVMFDFLKPGEKFSVTDYAKMAKNACYTAFKQNKLPIFVGGTGFYLKVLTEGISSVPDIPDEIVKELSLKAQESGIKELYNKLKLVDALLADRLKPEDSHRIIRGLAVHKYTGKTLSSYHKIKPRTPMPDVNFIKIALIPPRETLYNRIHGRFDIMLEEGVMSEAKNLYNSGYIFDNQALTSLGLREIFTYIEGKSDLNEAKENTLQQMRRYAKRQTTWLNNQYKADITITDCTKTEETINNIKKLLK